MLLLHLLPLPGLLHLILGDIWAVIGPVVREVETTGGKFTEEQFEQGLPHCFEFPSPPRTVPGSLRMTALENAATPAGDVADKIIIKHLCYKHRNMALELHAQHLPGPIQRQKGFLNGYQTIRRLFYSPHLTRLR